MKNLILVPVLLVLFFSCNKKADQLPTNKITLGVMDSLFSKTLNEQRKIWVYVPEGATKSPKAKYPVIYLLDGDAHFYSVAGMLHQLSTINGNTLVPEMIVVGIPNTDRTRDLTPTYVKEVFGDTTFSKTSGGGENFTTFISDELIPYMDSHYPTTAYRTLIGHSLRGLMSINTLVHHPNLFANYLAIDPSLWWDARKLTKQATTILDDTKFKNKFLYIAIANTMKEGMQLKELATDTTEDSEHIRAIFEFSEMGESKTAHGFKFESKYYAEDDHGSVPLIAEYDALHTMFSWYKLKGMGEYFDRKSKQTAADLTKMITNHYAKVSEHFGYPVLPPEGYVNGLGYAMMGNNMSDKAFALFEMNVKNYPESANVYDSMGDCYLTQKDTAQAYNQLHQGFVNGGY